MLVRGKILGESRASDIEIQDGRIVSIKPSGKRKPDIGSSDAHLAPPLFDIQVNGYGGIDLQRPDLTSEDLHKLDHKLAAQGIGYWIPTLITNAQHLMERNCRVIAEAMQDRVLRRRIPGIHLEGPYLSSDDGPRGAHAKKYIRKPNLREFDRCLKAADGNIVYTTVAPEVPGAIAYIKGVVNRGVIVSLGHHNASADQIARAVDAGATMVTHLGNGLAPMLPRHANPIWPQLADDRLACSIITDRHHIPDSMMKTFVRAKGPDRIILTSDVVHIAGMTPGRYELAGAPVELTAKGRICLRGTEMLAGSALNLWQGVLNVTRATDLSLEQAVASATTVPSRILKTSLRFPPPKVGKKAAFAVVTFDARTGAKVIALFFDGTLVTERSACSV